MFLEDRELPISATFGLTKERYENFFKKIRPPQVVFGLWTKEEIHFLMENNKNAIVPNGDSPTCIFCPRKRIKELIGILKEKSKLLFYYQPNGTNNIPILCVIADKHIFFIEKGKDGGNLFLHAEEFAKKIKEVFTCAMQ